jgi:hypothetical protein
MNERFGRRFVQERRLGPPKLFGPGLAFTAAFVRGDVR